MKRYILILLVILFSCERNLLPSTPIENYFYDETICIYGYEPDQIKIVTISVYDSIGSMIDSVCFNKTIEDSMETDSISYSKRNLNEFKIIKSPIKLFPKYNWKITIGKDVYLISDINVTSNSRCEMFYICNPIWELGGYKVNGKLMEHINEIVITTDDL